MTESIKTYHVLPPIPDRRWDWTAYRDPERRAGFGPSESAAILDLLTIEFEDGTDAEWTEEEREFFLQGVIS